MIDPPRSLAPKDGLSDIEQLSQRWLRRQYALDIWWVTLTYSIDPPEQFYVAGIMEQVKENSPESYISTLAVKTEIGLFSQEGMVRDIPTPDYLPRHVRTYERTESPKWAGATVFFEAITSIQLPSPRESIHGAVTKDDFIANWNPRGGKGAWTRLRKLALENADFPLRPAAKDPELMIGDVQEARLWLLDNGLGHTAAEPILKNIHNVRTGESSEN